MQSGSDDGGVGGEYNSADLVEIVEIFMTNNDFFSME